MRSVSHPDVYAVGDAGLAPGAGGTTLRMSPDDRVRSSVVTGRVAARIKELICTGAGWSIAHPTNMVPTRRRRIASAGTLSAATPR